MSFSFLFAGMSLNKFQVVRNEFFCLRFLTSQTQNLYQQKQMLITIYQELKIKIQKLAFSKI